MFQSLLITVAFFIIQLLVECHCWGTKESPRAHVARFYGRPRLIRSVLRASKFSVKIDRNCKFLGLLHHPFWLKLLSALFGIIFQLYNYFLWLRITDEGSIPEMRIWSILLIKSDLKWCIHFRRSLYLYFHYSDLHLSFISVCFWNY